jgi:hypothetical protein
MQEHNLNIYSYVNNGHAESGVSPPFWKNVNNGLGFVGPLDLSTMVVKYLSTCISGIANTIFMS